MSGKYCTLCVSLLALLLLTGCISAPQSAALLQQAQLQQPQPNFSKPVLLAKVPFFAQETYQCGPAALAMMLGASGVAVTPDALVPLVYVPERKGSFQFEMIAATRSKGRVAYEIPPTMAAIFSEVTAGQPVLVLQNLGLSWYQRWHYAVVTGFDLPRGKVIMNSGLIEHYEVSLATFEHTWARSKYWAMLVLTPGVMPVNADPVHYFNAVVAMEKTNAASVVALAYLSGLERWPHDRMLLMGYANLKYAEQDLVAAGGLYRSVTIDHPDYATAYNNLAQVQFELHEPAAAAVNARKAVALGGEHLQTFMDTLHTVTAQQP